MDALLLVVPYARAHNHKGQGDFLVAADGRIVGRRKAGATAPFVYTGIQILHPRVFEDVPQGAFSLNRLYDQAIEAERLYGVVHDGEWFHVGTPEGLQEAETYMHLRYASTTHR